jgi:glycerophosphoryl diester phosphodiesterase
MLPGLAPVIGNCGAAAQPPDNTLAGLRKAHELGISWVKFDVMLSGDEVPVLIHDETLRRTTTGRGRVAHHSAAEIQTLDAGRWFAAQSPASGR